MSKIPAEFQDPFCQKVLCHSDTALRLGMDNCCPEALVFNLQRLSNLLHAIQNHLGADYPLKVNSAFRSAELNAVVGGVSNSQHCLGLAADIVCPDLGSAWHLASLIERMNVPFDQLILEFNRWVHVSVAAEGDVPRAQVLTIFDSREGYLEGIIQR